MTHWTQYLLTCKLRKLLLITIEPTTATATITTTIPIDQDRRKQQMMTLWIFYWMIPIFNWSEKRC